MKNIIIQTISLVNSESQLFQLSTEQTHTSSCQYSETQISKSVAFKTQELVFKIFHRQKTSSGSQNYYCKQEKKYRSFCVSVLTTVMYTDKKKTTTTTSPASCSTTLGHLLIVFLIKLHVQMQLSKCFGLPCSMYDLASRQRNFITCEFIIMQQQHSCPRIPTNCIV